PAARPDRRRRRAGTDGSSLVPPPPPHPALDLLERDAQADRLHEIVERARFESAQLLLLGAVHRGENDAVGARAVSLQGGEDRIPVQGGEIDVQKQQRMRAPHVEREQLAQRIPPVTICQKPIPVRAQPVREQLGERRVVLHIDHFRHLQGVARRDGAGGGRGGGGGGAGGAGARGGGGGGGGGGAAGGPGGAGGGGGGRLRGRRRCWGRLRAGRSRR